MAFKDYVADVTNVISGGDEHIAVCMSEAGSNFTFDNVMGLLTEFSTFKISREVNEVELYHKLKPISKSGKVKIDDITITQLLTKEQFDKMIKIVEDETKVYVGWFDADREFERIFSGYGKVTGVEGSLTSHEYGKITATIHLDEYGIEATYTDEVTEG